MSGTNRIIISDNAKKGEGEEALVKDLENANEEAISIESNKD